MKSIQELFLLLAQRLYSLKTATVYISDFDFKKIMDGIEADIVIYSQDVVAKEVNRYLSQVSELIQENRNFFKYFVRIEYTMQTWQDEHGNTCSEEETKHVPLPEWQKDSVNESIHFELLYYQAILEKLKIFAGGIPAQRSNVEKASTRFYYKHFQTDSSRLNDLLNSLIRNGFIKANSDSRLFKNMFGGTGRIVNKIFWTGTLSSLCYLIKQLHRLEILDKKTNSSKWKITQSLFCDGNGVDFIADLKGQKPPNHSDKKLLDKMISNLVL